MVGPHVATHGGEGIGEGRTRLAVPSRGRDGQARLGAEPRGQERDDGEQAGPAGRGACDGEVRPLALGLDAEMVAHFPEGDFHLPALDEPADDLQRVAARIGAESGAGGAKRFWGSRSSTQRMGGTGKPAWRQTAVAEQISTTRSRSPYQAGTATGRQHVASSTSTSERLDRRAPLARGRPTVPGLRSGAGSYSAASSRRRVIAVIPCRANVTRKSKAAKLLSPGSTIPRSGSHRSRRERSGPRSGSRPQRRPRRGRACKAICRAQSVSFLCRLPCLRP